MLSIYFSQRKIIQTTHNINNCVLTNTKKTKKQQKKKQEGKKRGFTSLTPNGTKEGDVENGEGIRGQLPID